MHAEIQHRAAPDAEASSPLRRPRDLCTAAQGRGSVRGLVWGSCSPCPWARGCFALVTPHGKQSFPRCILATGFWFCCKQMWDLYFIRLLYPTFCIFLIFFLKCAWKTLKFYSKKKVVLIFLSLRSACGCWGELAGGNAGLFFFLWSADN